MFCRFCGAHIPDDSVFCSKCGKRLGAPVRPRLEKAVKVLRLKTPYPYFAILLILFVAWAIGPRKTRADYSNLKWSIEVGRTLNVPEENLYRQSLSVVLENMGSAAVQEVPVDIRARIEPQKPADVTADYLGREVLIMQRGRPVPVVLVLEGPVAPGAKRRYTLEGSIYAEAPFKVTYEVLEENSDAVLASYEVAP